MVVVVMSVENDFGCKIFEFFEGGTFDQKWFIIIIIICY